MRTNVPGARTGRKVTVPDPSRVRDHFPVGTSCDHGEMRENATVEDLCLVPTFARLLIAINEKDARRQRIERTHLRAFGITVTLGPPVSPKKTNGGRSCR